MSSTEKDPLVGQPAQDDGSDGGTAVDDHPCPMCPTCSWLQGSDRPPTVAEHFQQPFKTLVTRRAKCLFVTALAGTAAIFILADAEDTLQEHSELAFFLTLLVDMSGNVGGQTAAMMATALTPVQGNQDSPLSALGISNSFAIIRETKSGFFLGLIYSGMFAALSLLFDETARLAIVIAITLTLVSVAGAFVGAVIPAMALHCNIEPQNIAGPLVTTVCDIAGLLVYFVVASIVL